MNIKKSCVSVFLVLCMLIPLKAQKTYDHSALDRLDWKLAVQAYTFRLFTFEETLDKLNELGIKYVEMYPGQTIGGGIEGTTNFAMDRQTRDGLKKLLDSKGIRVINYGVVGANSEEQWIQLFEFAKEMGIETILSSPPARFFGLLEELCDKYQINLAIHNHPKPRSAYWDHEITLSALAGRSGRLGLAPDIGHWLRSGIEPLDAIKKSHGRIITLHMKDLNSSEMNSHDVPWGAGVCNIAGIMHELKTQGFKGVFSVEYEHNWENSMPEVAESIDYFLRVAHWLTE
jgi:sugar phosphate isomerase/epimerase